MNFLQKIFSPIILTISSLLLIYIFYKSEIVFNGKIRDYYFTYYILSSLLIFFSIVTFFINQKIKEYLIILVISLIVTLYLFEGYLTVKYSFTKEQLYEKQTGNKWDRKTLHSIYEDLKKKNNKIVVKVSPNNYLSKNYSIFPLSSVSNSETIHCNENGYYSIYQSDRYGFNNPDEEWDNKEIEYLLIGDSFVDGSCVNRPHDIASVLRTLSNKSVLNLGYSGNGPLIEFATLREYLNLNVKKVLWFYFESNDLIELSSEKDNKILINYLNDFNFTQNLKLRQNEVNDLAINLMESKKESFKFSLKLIKFIQISNLRYLIYPPAPAPAPASAAEFKEILKLAKNLSSKNNSKLFFVFLPSYVRYVTKYDNTNYNLIKNIVRELDIPFVDIHKEVFEKEENPLKLFPFELIGHYNVEGYKKIAETLYKFTKD